jgi:hypothetical protein
MSDTIVTIENRVQTVEVQGGGTLSLPDTGQVQLVTAGAMGPAGQGIPTGGASGQYLRKNSGADFDTAWANVSAGVSSVFGRTGAISAQAGDYSLSQLSGVLGEASGGTGANNYYEALLNLYNSIAPDQIQSTTTTSLLANDSGYQFSITLDQLLNELLGMVSVLTPSVARTSNYTMQTGISYVEFDCSAGNLTLTLPSPTSGFYGREVSVKKTNATNTLTISAAAIDGVTSVSLSTQWSCITLRGYSTGWRIISRYL